MPHIAISMYPGRSREEKAALAEKWQEHLDAIPGEERFY